MKNKTIRLLAVVGFVLVGLLSIGETVTHAASGIPVYRMYNPNSGEHFYTQSLYEARQLHDKHRWNYEGIQSYQPESGAPVYRLYNPNAGVHFYTKDNNERNHLVRLGWRAEGTSFISGGSVPIYRAYNPNNSQHNYTTHMSEQNHLTSVGWRGEGKGFDAAAQGNPLDNSIDRTPIWHNNVLHQDDPKWGKIRVGKNTLASSGCGPTSITMVINGYGAKYTPVTVANTARSIGRYNVDDCGIDGATIDKTLKHYNMNVTHITNEQQLIKELQAGKPVVFGMQWLYQYPPNVGHFVLLHGYSNGNTVVNDPLHRVSGWNSVNRLWTHATRVPDDLNAGFPAWSAIPK